jgi:hypothetical protein
LEQGFGETLAIAFPVGGATEFAVFEELNRTDFFTAI